jgi:transposase
MLADEVDYVVGVDTHRDEHVLAVVVAPSGALVAQRSVRASARGYAQSLRFVEQHCSGDACGRSKALVITVPGLLAT